MSGPSAADLDNLIASSNEALKKLKEGKSAIPSPSSLEKDIENHAIAIKKIEEMQKTRSAAGWQQRVSRYLQREGSGLFWLISTGLLFGMAWNRLQEKYEFEVSSGAWCKGAWAHPPCPCVALRGGGGVLHGRGGRARLHASPGLLGWTCASFLALDLDVLLFSMLRSTAIRAQALKRELEDEKKALSLERARCGEGLPCGRGRFSGRGRLRRTARAEASNSSPRLGTAALHPRPGWNARGVGSPVSSRHCWTV